jgi:putative NADH-flavin reductase
MAPLRWSFFVETRARIFDTSNGCRGENCRVAFRKAIFRSKLACYREVAGLPKVGRAPPGPPNSLQKILLEIFCYSGVMKIVVVGGSRGIGKQIVLAALHSGHEVTVFARRPEQLDVKHPHLHLQAGNVLDEASVRQAVAGQEVVICTLGLPTLQAIGLPFTKRSYVLSKGTENILHAMKQIGTKRLLCVTAIGTGNSVRECTLVARIAFRYGLHWLFKQKDRQEQLIQASSGIDWTIIRPTALTNGRTRGALVGKDLRSGILTHISRADVAAIMLELIGQKTSFHEALSLSYPRRFGDSVRWVAGYFGKG